MDYIFLCKISRFKIFFDNRLGKIPCLWFKVIFDVNSEKHKGFRVSNLFNSKDKLSRESRSCLSLAYTMEWLNSKVNLFQLSLKINSPKSLGTWKEFKKFKTPFEINYWIKTGVLNPLPSPLIFLITWISRRRWDLAWPERESLSFEFSL